MISKIKHFILSVVNDRFQADEKLLSELCATLEKNTQLLLELSDQMNQMKANQIKSLNEQEAHGPNEPIQTTRQSWPRMKRIFEERDVRSLLQERDNAARNQTMIRIGSEEADRIEKYWKDKGAS